MAGSCGPCNIPGPVSKEGILDTGKATSLNYSNFKGNCEEMYILGVNSVQFLTAYECS